VSLPKEVPLHHRHLLLLLGPPLKVHGAIAARQIATSPRLFTLCGLDPLADLKT
jgi:hypothetical protein